MRISIIFFNNGFFIKVTLNLFILFHSSFSDKIVCKNINLYRPIQFESIIAIRFESVNMFLGGNMQFNERLKELRKQSNLLQKNVADFLGVSVITIRQYEQGTREPNIEKLLKLAAFFNVSLDDLLCFDDFKKVFLIPSDE